MREIIPGILWIGNRNDIHNLSSLYEQNIQAILDLAIEEPPLNLNRDLVNCRFPIIDGEGNTQGFLETVIQTTVSLIRNQVPLIVICSAGMSRSPVIVAASLSMIKDQPPDEILEELVEDHPNDVSIPLWNDVKNLAKFLYSD